MLKSATDFAQQAIDLDSESTFGYVALAQALRRTGQDAKAIYLLESAKGAGIDDSWRSLSLLASLYVGAGRDRDAQSALEKALELGPNDRDLIATQLVTVFRRVARIRI